MKKYSCSEKRTNLNPFLQKTKWPITFKLVLNSSLMSVTLLSCIWCMFIWWASSCIYKLYIIIYFLYLQGINNVQIKCKKRTIFKRDWWAKDLWFWWRPILWSRASTTFFQKVESLKSITHDLIHVIIMLEKGSCRTSQNWQFYYRYD